MATPEIYGSSVYIELDKLSGRINSYTSDIGIIAEWLERPVSVRVKVAFKGERRNSYGYTVKEELGRPYATEAHFTDGAYEEVGGFARQCLEEELTDIAFAWCNSSECEVAIDEAVVSEIAKMARDVLNSESFIGIEEMRGVIDFNADHLNPQTRFGLESLVEKLRETQPTLDRLIKGDYRPPVSWFAEQLADQNPDIELLSMLYNDHPEMTLEELGALTAQETVEGDTVQLPFVPESINEVPTVPIEKFLVGAAGGAVYEVYPGAFLEGADLRDVDLQDRDMTDALLCGADLSGTGLIGAILRGADLEDARLDHANLDGADLTDASLKGANLDGADLTDASLKGADLSGTDLIGAMLRGADLEDARLDHANLSGAWLHDTNLTNADLREADLRGTYLAGATFVGANLTGAQVRNGDELVPAVLSLSGWEFYPGTDKLRRDVAWVAEQLADQKPDIELLSMLCNDHPEMTLEELGALAGTAEPEVVSPPDELYVVDPADLVHNAALDEEFLFNDVTKDASTAAERGNQITAELHGLTWTPTYDEFGRELTSTCSNGATKVSTYDTDGTAHSELQSWENGLIYNETVYPSGLTISETKRYNEDGQLIEHVHDGPKGPLTTTYEYDAKGNAIKAITTQPDGTVSVKKIDPPTDEREIGGPTR